mmetsp:Transcript_390/g.1271  ORF Transcript_390/g.1271 Transcript_390/m.1271 type:complete len:290 (-) Transcript_390:276-1145(-)
MTTLFAPCRFRPVPPAFVLIRKRNRAGCALKSSQRRCRSAGSVLPSRRQNTYPRPIAKLSRMSRILVDCEKSSTLSPASDHRRRSTSRTAILPQWRVCRRRSTSASGHSPPISSASSASAMSATASPLARLSPSRSSGFALTSSRWFETRCSSEMLAITMQYGHSTRPPSSLACLAWSNERKKGPSHDVWQHRPLFSPDPQSHGSSCRTSSCMSSLSISLLYTLLCSSLISQNTTLSVLPSSSSRRYSSFLRTRRCLSMSFRSCLDRSFPLPISRSVAFALLPWLMAEP